MEEERKIQEEEEKKVRKSYSIEKKLEIVRHAEKANNLHETSRYFNVDRKSIREWMQQVSELLQI